MNRELKKILTGIIFHNLRILHGVTKRDTYIENYKWHWKKWGDDFFDLYHFAFWWGLNHHPKKIIEIGCRTGLSLAQLLSAYLDFDGMRVVIFDRFDDSLSCPELVKKHLEHLAIPTDFIEFHTGDSAETVPEFKKTNKDKFGWVLVDGSHVEECVTKDLENVKDLVAENGVLVIDDIASLPEDNISVKPAWEKFKVKYSQQFIFREDMHGKGVGYGVRNSKPLCLSCNSLNH